MFLKHGYSQRFIDDAKIKACINKDRLIPTKKKFDYNKCMVVPYESSQHRKLKNICKKFNIDLVERPSSTLESHLSLHKRRDLIPRGTVYKLEFDECPQFYIGETGQILKDTE